jgi:Gluconate 2-dehydrogenase subunit 3
MAGQGMERREILRVLALAAGASGMPGFHRWAFACGHGAPDVITLGTAYTPKFFTADEYRTVEQLASIILPSDGTPGAHEAGASEFIDFMVASDPAIQYRVRLGLTWLDAAAQAAHQRRFADLTLDQQTALLEPLAYKQKATGHPSEAEGRAFFALMREYTLMGFYTSRIGLEQLGYPGLQFYSESPGCPHTDDREHAHLPAPKR